MAKFAAKDSNKNITLSPHGTGKVVVGTGATDATVQSDGNHNLVLQTGNSTTGSITITDGADGNIAISPNGTGTVVVNTDLDVDNININGNAITSTNTDGNIDLTPNGTGEIVIGSGSASGKITSSGANDLVLDTNAGTNSGSITITDGADGNINITTNGTGKIIASTLQADNILIDSNAITSTNTDGNIDLTPNGTGEVNISKVDIDSGTVDGLTQLTVDNLKLDGNSLTSTNSNGDINLTPDGTGKVVASNASNASTINIVGAGVPNAETSFLDLIAASASDGNVMGRIKGIRGSGSGDTEGHIAFSVKSAANTITERLRISASGSITTPNSTEFNGTIGSSATINGTFNGTIGTSASGSANLPAVKTALNASGNAGIYACRAWVSFPGNTSSPTANASGNVSGITYHATGDFTITIDDDLDDVNYAVMGSCIDTGSGAKHLEFTSLAVGSVRVKITRSNGSSAKTLESSAGVFVAFFR
jgi:uncharacterized protein YuzE